MQAGQTQIWQLASAQRPNHKVLLWWGFKADVKPGRQVSECRSGLVMVTYYFRTYRKKKNVSQRNLNMLAPKNFPTPNCLLLGHPSRMSNAGKLKLCFSSRVFFQSWIKLNVNTNLVSKKRIDDTLFSTDFMWDTSFSACRKDLIEGFRCMKQTK